MANLRKTLVKMPHLITFEAASRNINFTRVAEEFGVTRVSVSRQIAELEETIGVRLFHRGHRKVSLTMAGHALASEVCPALHQIAGAMQNVAASSGEARLCVTATAAFATYWLIPRLVDFTNRYPEIELNLVVSDRMLDLDTEGVDIAIRYSDRPPQWKNVTKLLQERVFPVVSPKYRARTSLAGPEDLLSENLIHLSGIYRPGARWSNWFRLNNLLPPPESSGVVMNTYINMLQAAIAGHGIALAGYPLVDSYLADGSLRKLNGFLEYDRDFFFPRRHSEVQQSPPSRNEGVARMEGWRRRRKNQHPRALISATDGINLDSGDTDRGHLPTQGAAWRLQAQRNPSRGPRESRVSVVMVFRDRPAPRRTPPQACDIRAPCGAFD